MPEPMDDDPQLIAPTTDDTGPDGIADPDPAGTDGDGVGVDEPGAAEPVTDPTLLDHDPTGLELAHRIASAIGRGTDSRPKPTKRPRQTPNRSATRRRDRDPRLLGAMLEHLVTDRGWSTELNVHTLLGRWPSLVGEANAQHSTPESYQEGLLVVRADSTVWATSLRTIAHQLVARLNEELGQGTITQVRVLGPNGPSWKRGRRSVPGPGPRDTYG